MKILSPTIGSRKSPPSSQLDHPNVVRLEEVYESEAAIYLVMELCTGGDLFDRLSDKPNHRYTEEACARVVKQICSSVRYLHSKGIIHRDLKLENFLFSTSEKDSEIKMCDFGLSKHFQIGDKHSEVVGTPYSVAPEVILGSYNEKCDVWAIGVVTYVLLCGEVRTTGIANPATAALLSKMFSLAFPFCFSALGSRHLVDAMTRHRVECCNYAKTL